MSKRFIMIAGAAGWMALGVVGSMGFIRHGIEKDVDRWITTAQLAHPSPGDDLAALLAYLESDTHSLTERNQAVWAIGQYRNSRALETLEKYRTGSDCSHERDLCQRELEKAIRLCRR